MKELARAASTPPASVKETDGKGVASTTKDNLGPLRMEARKTQPDGVGASPLDNELIAPYIDLSNCTRAEISPDSVAAHAIIVYGVEDFTSRNYVVKSRAPKAKEAEDRDDHGACCGGPPVPMPMPGGRPGDGSDSEDESSSEDEHPYTRLLLGMGIHETEFRGAKVFLEIRFMKDGPKSFMTRNDSIEHNKTMAIFVEGIGRGDFIQDFLEEMIKRIPVEVKKKDPPVKNEFKIYRWNHSYGDWSVHQRQKGRDMKSVILPQGEIERIEKDMTEFLSAETAAWYDCFGIPYKRSYLFHGVPGSGKTSLICALAGKLSRNVCFLSAHNPRFTDDGMKNAMERLPRDAFLILEDIDSLFNKRTSMNNNSPLTFTGLLNCLDGIGHASGQIVIMTTNYINRLDEALIRAGRADMWVEFTHATKWQLQELFKWFYHKTPEDAEKWSETFAANCASKFRGVTIAEMQQHFVDSRKLSAEECAKAVLGYDMPCRKFTIGDKAKARLEYEDTTTYEKNYEKQFPPMPSGGKRRQGDRKR